MNDIRQLLYRILLHLASEKEEKELRAWASGHRDREAMLERLSDPEYVAKQLLLAELTPYEQALQDMQRRVKPQRKVWKKTLAYAASAAAVAAVAFGVTMLLKQSESTPGLAQIAEMSRPATPARSSFEEITPGTAQARLLSSDGTSNILSGTDTLLNLAASSNTTKKMPNVKVPVEMCLDVPRGGEFKVILEDSTEVWLNAATTLSYPEHFTASERRVKVKGEAYFKVRRDEGRPFVVEASSMQAKVYGTEFNIRAYDGDQYIATTLASGSVAISPLSNPTAEMMLKPSLQSLYNPDNEKLILRKVDTGSVTAWRHGKFVFEEQTLGTIMADLARWYDFEFVFEDQDLCAIVFMGSIPRYTDFKTSINFLKQSGDIDFILENGKVKVVRANHGL